MDAVLCPGVGSRERSTAPAGRELLFLSDSEVAVVSVEDDGEAIWIGITRRSAGAECPGCGRWSNRVHGSYLRFPADLPSVGRRVMLCLRVRRFTCADTSCRRQTFVEHVPGATRRHAQRTERLRAALAEVGLASAGRAGARLCPACEPPPGRLTSQVVIAARGGSQRGPFLSVAGRSGRTPLSR
ncbi:transposase family protein [Streptomyces sp. SJL17-1]|uniref:transposase family protein n=1 Tax=Streptomyces sp. SJL17-1 TaxID=2967223 RepID=UPI002966CB49|nr:transposase family protein [Streptomyces sp. SJL17-1]